MACPRDLVDLLLPDPKRANNALMEKLSHADAEEVAKIVKREFKDAAFEDIFLRNFKAAMSSFYSTMYTKRSFWRDGINLKTS